MPYIEIVRGKFGGSTMPKDVIRVNKGSLSISPNIGEQFQSTRTRSEAGTEIVKLGLAVDTDTKQIKLVPGAVNAFSFITKNASASLHLNKPRKFKELNLPTGDYLLVEGSELEFKLAE